MSYYDPVASTLPDEPIDCFLSETNIISSADCVRAELTVNIEIFTDSLLSE